MIHQQSKQLASRETFSHNFKVIMIHLDMDIKMIAERLDIDEMRVRRWQDGVCYPQLGFLAQLCKTIGYFDIYRLITKRLTPEEIATIPKK